MAKIMRKEGKDALVGAEPEAVSSSGLIMQARYLYEKLKVVNKTIVEINLIMEANKKLCK